MTLSIYFLTPS